MSLEIERKFLIKSAPSNLDAHPARRLRQGYLTVPGDSIEIRIRDDAGTYNQTLKRGGGKVREEIEVAIDRVQFDALWPQTLARRIEKVRYGIPVDNVLIELDVYEGCLQGLMVAEVEFSDESSSDMFQPPDWFDVEVTGWIEFKNSNLAVNQRIPDIVC